MKYMVIVFKAIIWSKIITFWHIYEVIFFLIENPWNLQTYLFLKGKSNIVFHFSLEIVFFEEKNSKLDILSKFCAIFHVSSLLSDVFLTSDLIENAWNLQVSLHYTVRILILDRKSNRNLRLPLKLRNFPEKSVKINVCAGFWSKGTKR